MGVVFSPLAPQRLGKYFDDMTAVEIIEEIKRLPRDEQSRVIEFARHAGENRQLSLEELGQLSKRMVETQDSAEADRLQETIERGFYGGQPRLKSAA